MLVLLLILAILIGLGGVYVIGRGLESNLRYRDSMKVWKKNKARHRDFDNPEPERTPAPHWLLGAVLLLISLLLLFVLSGATVVKAHEVAVVENTLYGQYHVLEPGTHVWPFSRQIMPVVTNVTKYSLRQQRIEIGMPPNADAPVPEGKTRTQVYGIACASASDGQPVVFIQGRGWARPNKEHIIQLHLRHGPDYLDTWVETQWVTSIKDIQGRKEYDYLREDRAGMQSDIEMALQAEMVDDKENVLVEVSQLAIPDYDYEPEMNEWLKQLVDMENQKKLAIGRQSKNREDQIADIIQQTTEYSKTVISADANRYALVTNADAQRQAREKEADGAAYAARAAATAKAYEVTQIADAEAYRIAAEYGAEADGIALVVRAVGGSNNYLVREKYHAWDGVLPEWYMPGGDGQLPLPIVQPDLGD